MFPKEPPWTIFSSAILVKVAPAVLEALAMGLPVVTTRQNGASEVIDPGAFAWEPQGKDNLDIYFETDDLEAAYLAVASSGAEAAMARPAGRVCGTGAG